MASINTQCVASSINEITYTAFNAGIAIDPSNITPYTLNGTTFTKAYAFTNTNTASTNSFVASGYTKIGVLLVGGGGGGGGYLSSPPATVQVAVVEEVYVWELHK